MKKIKFSKAVFFIIFFVALFFRFYNLSYESIWLDESISIRFADRSLLETINEDIHENTPPLFDTVLNIWISIFGTSAKAVRSLSAIIGTLSVILLYLLGKNIFNKKIGIMAALLLCFSPFHIYYSQEARTYVLFSFITLMSFFFYNEYKKDGTKKFMYVISSVLMLYSHIFGILSILVQNIHFIITKKITRNWIFLQAIILIFFLPLVFVIFSRINSFVTVNGIWIQRPTIVGDTQFSLIQTLAWFCGSKMGAYLIFALVSFYIIGFFINKTQKFSPNHLLLLFWVFLPLISVFIFSLISIPLFVARYFIFILPAFYLLTSILLDSINFKPLQIIFFVLLIIGSLNASFHQYHDYNKAKWSDLSNYIKEKRNENETIIITAPYMVNAFSYYYDYSCLVSPDTPYIDCPKKGIIPMNYSSQVTEQMLENPIWLIYSQAKLADQNESILKFLLINKELNQNISFYNGLNLYYFK